MQESLQNPILGFLAWDEQLQWWIGGVDLKPNQPIEICISTEADPPEAVLPRVRAGLDRIRANDRDYRRWTAEQVVDGRWNTDEVMSIEDITNLMRIASIDLHSAGGAGLYLDDDDRLYWGHNLFTEVDADGKCTEVRIEG